MWVADFSKNPDKRSAALEAELLAVVLLQENSMGSNALIDVRSLLTAVMQDKDK